VIAEALLAAASAPPALVAAAPATRPAAARPSVPLRWRRDLDTPRATNLRWTPDGKLLAYAPAETPGVVAFVDPAGAGAPLFSLGEPDPAGADLPVRTSAFALSPDGHLLAAPLRGGAVRLWDLRTRDVARELAGQGEEIKSLAFDPAGRWLATGGHAYGLALWDVAKGRLLGKHAQPARAEHGQTTLAFSTDRKWLLGAGADHEISQWRVPSLALTSAIDGFPSTTFETDGRVVAFRDRNGLRIWDLKSGERVTAGPYWQVAVRPGGRQVLGRSEAGRLVVIDVASRRARPTGVTFSLPAEAAYSPDGKTLAVARGGARGIRLYDVAP
jgi:WD40 repeat protein